VHVQRCIIRASKPTKFDERMSEGKCEKYIHNEESSLSVNLEGEEESAVETRLRSRR
jgi:hypothetical protein